MQGQGEGQVVHVRERTRSLFSQALAGVVLLVLWPFVWLVTKIDAVMLRSASKSDRRETVA